MENDKRFAHIATDPKFRRIPNAERKVKIDKRFKSMLHDKAFQVKYTVDKRGRPISHSTTEDLRRYYDLDSEDEEDEDSEEKQDQKSKHAKSVVSDRVNDAKLLEEEQCDNNSIANSESENELAKTDKTDGQVSEKVRKKLKNLKVDYARGEGQLYSESSSDDGEESEEEVEEVEAGIDHKWGELDADAGYTNDISRRLAACNMDWDRIRAQDLMVLFSSFLPPGGSIKSVSIYASEFGKKRMAEEEVKGPTELVTFHSDDEDGNTEGSKYHMEKLRMYQLNRLKYYYAVIVCDAPTTANKLYSDCDGIEYESSATKIDLRFIPDEVSFDEDKPKETCTSLPDAHKYKPRFFTTTALQQAKVSLTWDETSPDRIELTKKLYSGKATDIDNADVQAYLASSSEEESTERGEEGNDVDADSRSTTDLIEKYKLLVQELVEKEKAKENRDVGMEITWGIDLQKKTDEIIKAKHLSMESKTPFEQYLDKRKKKRKEKKAAKKHQTNNEEREGGTSDSDVPEGIDLNDSYFAEEFDKPEFRNTKKKSKSQKAAAKRQDSTDEENGKMNLEKLKLLVDDGDSKQHFSLKKIQEQENESKSKKKRNNKKRVATTDQQPDEFKINVYDERFSALYTSHHYNIDPSDPHYRKTKNMEKLISEKIKRRANEDGESDAKKAKLSPNQSNSKSTELNILVKSVKRKTKALKKGHS